MSPEELKEFKEMVDAMHPEEPEMETFTTSNANDITVISNISA